MSSDQRPPQEERLQEEIQELRSDLGGTVEALVHKVDVPARAKERGSELGKRAIDAAERTREAVGQTQMDRWARLATAGVALITLVVIVRRVRRS
jgi:hypothetical protein